jgi:RNA polymerase sigma factor (sigma-70 family)
VVPGETEDPGSGPDPTVGKKLSWFSNLSIFSISYICSSYLDRPTTIQPAIVIKAGQGDEDAQAWLYQQYSKAMFNICIRMTGNRSNAEDILQDVFILVFGKLHQLKQPENFEGWLRRIVVNECIRYCRRSFSWKSWDDHPMEIAEDDTEWWTTISMAQIHEEIKNLPEGCRQVFVLYVLEDRSHKEIADDLGISEGTSKSQYHRARQLLKERIMRQMNK